MTVQLNLRNMAGAVTTHPNTGRSIDEPAASRWTRPAVIAILAVAVLVGALALRDSSPTHKADTTPRNAVSAGHEPLIIAEEQAFIDRLHSPVVQTARLSTCSANSPTGGSAGARATLRRRDICAVARGPAWGRWTARSRWRQGRIPESAQQRRRRWPKTPPSTSATSSCVAAEEYSTSLRNICSRPGRLQEGELGHLLVAERCNRTNRCEGLGDRGLRLGVRGLGDRKLFQGRLGRELLDREPP